MGIIIRQSIKGTIVNYIGVLIGIFTTFFILTDLLKPEEIGLTRVLIDAGMLFAGLAQLGTSSSIIRFFPYFNDQEKKHNGFFFWTLIIPIIGFVIFLVLFIVLKTPICNFFGDKSPLFNQYYFLLAPLSFFMLYMTVFETNANVLMRIVVPKLVREVIVRILTLGTYLLYGYNFINFNQFIFAFCAVYGVAAIINIIYLFSLKNISFKPNLKYIAPAVRRDFMFYSIFIITTTLVSAITPSLNTFFISAKMGLAFTGVFAIANYMAAFIEIPYRSLGSITQPQISQAVKENDFKTTNYLCQSVALHQLIAGSLIILAIWINIDLIFSIMPNGNAYAAGKYVVLILGFTRLFNATYSVGTTVLGFSRYYYYSLAFTVILTLSAILFNIWFIPKMGMEGAAYASLFSTLIYTLLLLALIRWKLKTTPFHSKQTIVILIVVGLYLISLLWDHTISKVMVQLPMKLIYAQVIDGIIKTSILLFTGMYIIIKFKISPEMNAVLNSMYQKVRTRK
ncbi:MAG TPA: oligosaccharide flippase family protein [Bacteroidales bacterium]|mgnify:CR=1 FL=1|jgi:O-antigen/teichoic acid export membrane protein|nr:oligosaccharide flippase family protein [Bacteroidales bacterium]HPS71858.1 oligosaccharide flippase family protein [Bacteroidales bacterium]